MTRTLLALALVACGGSEPAASTAPAPAEPAAAAAPKGHEGHEGHDDHAAFAEISFEELSGLVAAKEVVLLDANGTESFAEGHIPGALDFEAVSASLQASLPEAKDTLVVAYCGGPSCGAWKKAAEAVATLGYGNVKHFKGGISGWKSAEGPVEM
ncbi:MAG: hypothetical protein H6732_17290 [Alphaproteobacteria bacterium]|nr:hypothetical protein [Alphaproteobacteria bacterium]